MNVVEITAILYAFQLSVEPADGFSFCGTAFSLHEGVDASSLLTREEEFGFEVVEFEELGGIGGGTGISAGTGTGIVCTSSTDAIYFARWGKSKFSQRYSPHGIFSIWDDWNRPDSGILPCSVYLRHVYLAAQNAGEEMLRSLLDETFLVDRKTTIRQYLEGHPEVLTTEPPDSVKGRYDG
jgi:hypothetical protein